MTKTIKSPISSKYTKLLKEVKLVYADCDEKLSRDKAEQLRNLNYRSSIDASPEEAYRITKACIGGGYNNFEPKLIKLFDKDCKIQIAREGSVCLYVKGDNLPSISKLRADEYDLKNGWTMIWWD